jgi:hypothetical protein
LKSQRKIELSAAKLHPAFVCHSLAQPRTHFSPLGLSK